MASMPGYRVKPFSLAPGQVDAIETALVSLHCRYIDRSQVSRLLWRRFSNRDSADSIYSSVADRSGSRGPILEDGTLPPMAGRPGAGLCCYIKRTKPRRVKPSRARSRRKEPAGRRTCGEAIRWPDRRLGLTTQGKAFHSCYPPKSTFLMPI